MLKYIIFIIIFIIVGSGVFLFFVRDIVDNEVVVDIVNIKNSEENINDKGDVQEVPLVRINNRIIKKPFGIFITPESSPVQPEKFHGYHTGADFEIFEDELNSEVKVFAICDGKVIVKRFVSGYGGILIQDCILDERVVTVLYGHLALDTIQYDIGNQLNTFDNIGLLGEDNTAETDFERKHLHLGIHQENDIDVRGYTQNQIELNEWLEPCDFIDCKKSAE